MTGAKKELDDASESERIYLKQPLGENLKRTRLRQKMKDQISLVEKHENAFLEFIKAEVPVDLGHDIYHVLRVVKSAKMLCLQENARYDIVVPAAYLHDCFSFEKSHPLRHQSSQYAAEKAIQFLKSIEYPIELYDEIYHAILAHSFSAKIETKTLEAKIVQDADRLDAIGAIGIARCLFTGAQLGRPFYAENDPFCMTRQADDGRYTIDHFYAKLLHLVDTMKTQSARKEAERRTDFLKLYLEQLASEV